ncbi:hypothetical protein [Plantactinospora sonchi]|uniref:DUF4118 domain-containing protein n=1 Tax=Plantactinospora sonchi TaxID=1544735 RepID=A0ABU7S308_9ACTN
MTSSDSGPESDRAWRTPTGISVAVGSVLVVLAACVAAALFPPRDLAPRLVVMAVAAGVFAARVADLWAVSWVGGLSVLVFTGFLANRYGELTTREGDLWWYGLAVVVATALGIAYRRIRAWIAARSTARRPGRQRAPRRGGLTEEAQQEDLLRGQPQR